MRQIVPMLLFVVLLASCASHRHSSSVVDGHSHHDMVVVHDTMRVVHHREEVDSLTTETHTTIRETITEEFDPETGQLRKRITESETSIAAMQQQIRAMQLLFDSLSANGYTHTNDSTSTHVVQEEEQKTGTASLSPWQTLAGRIGLVVGLALFAVVLFVVLKVFLPLHRH